MSLTPWEERQILKDIVDGLGSAIAERDDWEVSQVDPIKFNKLLYLAIDDFDLPITYRWYKYGFDVTHRGMGPDDLTPTATQDLPSPNEPRVPETPELGDLPSPRDYCEFYLNDGPELNQIFESETKNYLRDFYEDYAPEEFEDLYVTCAIFQKSLDEMGHAEHPNKIIKQKFNTIDEELRKLNREIVIQDDITTSKEPFFKYADLFRDILSDLYEREEDLTWSQRETFRDVVAFFYDEAWRFVALEIAESGNIGGDARRNLLDNTVSSLESLEKNYSRQVESLRNQCIHSRLIENRIRPTDAPPRVLVEAYQERQEETKAVNDEWSNASTEANEEW